MFIAIDRFSDLTKIEKKCTMYLHHVHTMYAKVKELKYKISNYITCYEENNYLKVPTYVNYYYSYY